MTPLREMIATHPHVKGNINEPLAAAAESAALCAAICVDRRGKGTPLAG